MTLSDIVNSISTVANGASAVKQIHDVGRSFADQYGNVQGPSAQELTMYADQNVKVNKPVRFWGTGTGIISIYSSSKLEREVIADPKGDWYTRLFFSVPGTYEMRATDKYGETTLTVVATA